LVANKRDKESFKIAKKEVKPFLAITLNLNVLTLLQHHRDLNGILSVQIMTNHEDEPRTNLLLVVGIMLFIGSLFLSVYIFSQPAIWNYWDLSEKGSVGDALNGITAPFIGTVGAILIFISFNEQVKANKLQFTALRQQRELDITFKFYMELKDDLTDIQARFGPLYHQPSMLDAFMQEIYHERSRQSSYPELYKFIQYLNDQFMFLSHRLISNPDLSDDDSMAIIEKVKRLYGFYFANYYDTIVSRNWQKELGIGFKSQIELVYVSMRHMDGYYDH
jgi:hypothetical protein